MGWTKAEGDPFYRPAQPSKPPVLSREFLDSLIDEMVRDNCVVNDECNCYLGASALRDAILESLSQEAKMGDVRHRAFADLITDLWPDRRARIADVAGGKGYRLAELYRRGYRNVVTFDKRGRQWTTRKHYHWAVRCDDCIEGLRPGCRDAPRRRD